MHAQPYSETSTNTGRRRGRTSGGKRPLEVQVVRDLLHSRSGSGSGCITDQSYFGVASRVYQSWLLRFSRRIAFTSATTATTATRLTQFRPFLAALFGNNRQGLRFFFNVLSRSR